MCRLRPNSDSARRRSSPVSSPSSRSRSGHRSSSPPSRSPRIGTRLINARGRAVASRDSPLGRDRAAAELDAAPAPGAAAEVDDQLATVAGERARRALRGEPVGQLDRSAGRSETPAGVGRIAPMGRSSRGSGWWRSPSQAAVEPERHQRANPATVSQKLASMIGMSVNTFCDRAASSNARQLRTDAGRSRARRIRPSASSDTQASASPRGDSAQPEASRRPRADRLRQTGARVGRDGRRSVARPPRPRRPSRCIRASTSPVSSGCDDRGDGSSPAPAGWSRRTSIGLARGARDRADQRQPPRACRR